MKIELRTSLRGYKLFFLLFFLFNFKISYSFLVIPDSLYKVSLNGTWSFKTDSYNVGEKEHWYKDDHNTSHWDNLTVPGNWDTQNEYADYAGKAWYKREFKIENGWADKNVRLFFESVYNESKIWINGRRVGENQLGFLPFFFDINEYLRLGSKNTIVVLVDNTLKRGAMWNWGGIRRPVWLEVTDKNRLEYQHISAIPDLKKSIVPVKLSFELNNLGDEGSDLGYSWEIIKDGAIVWKQNNLKHLRVNPKSSIVENMNIQFPLSKIQLWHFNQPNLYTSIIRLYKNGVEIHRLEDRFGIRKIEIDGQKLRLNGESIRTVGFNLVADDRTTGNTLPVWRFKEDVDLMKSAGANMARLSHQPLPKEFLDYLDEKGIMTFEEVALWGKDMMVDPEHPTPKEWLSKMIKYKYNHPSIIGWSVGNEIGFQDANPKVMEYVAGAIRQAKQEDPSRIAVYVTHSADTQERDASQFSDMILMNEYSKWGISAEKVHRNQPGKPIFYSEYGSKITSEDPNKGDIDAKNMLDEIRNKPYLMGASLWTFNDYRSSYSGTPASENRSWGIVNVFRQKKRAYYTFRKEYSPFEEVKLEGTTKVTLQPRSITDIPAYKITGYRLVWEGNDRDGNLVDGGFLKLPEIEPGDKQMSRKLVWNQPEINFASIKLSIIDPQGYSVYDTIAYSIKPDQPKIISTHSESKKIRVVFQKGVLATSWKVRYKIKNIIKETAETINDFVDVGGLEPGNTYQLELIAINNAGEGVSSLVAVKTTSEELPPIVWHTEAADNGFFVGYSVDPKDYLYQIQYGTASGDYDNFHLIQFRTKGVYNISGLTNGKTYYYRLRRLMQWGFASDWTKEIAIVPGAKPTQPKPLGVLREGKEAVLIFTPSEKAEGYFIRYTHIKRGTVREIYVNASKINYIILRDLLEKGDYKFEIATIDSKSVSNYSSF